MLKRSMCIAVVVASSLQLAAQTRPRTIPEQLRTAGEPLFHAVTIPSGQPPAVDLVLRETDVVIRGILGSSRSYLSADEMRVYTDYTLSFPAVLFDRRPEPSRNSQPLTSATVTFLGGEVNVNGLTFSSVHQALPLPEPGTECVLFLTQEDGQLVVAGQYYGAFAVTGDQLMPLSAKRDYAAGLRGQSAAVVLGTLAKRLDVIHGRAR